MNQLEVIKARHSVRRFTPQPLDEHAVSVLKAEIEAVNAQGGLRIQLALEEPEAFVAGKPSYGKFKGCKNYLALVGPKAHEEAIGYFGERLVLKAQELGINSCWVGLTFKHGKVDVRVDRGEKLYGVIALGYGETQGVSHKVKTLEAVSDYTPGDPAWYKQGVEAALLAPTAVNQQQFFFRRDGEKVVARAKFGPMSKIDLGIVKYHFEIGSGKDATVWA